MKFLFPWKKHLIIGFVCLISQTIQAQSWNLHFGGQATFFRTQYINPADLFTDEGAGIFLGLTREIPIKGNFTIEPGLVLNVDFFGYFENNSYEGEAFVQIIGEYFPAYEETQLYSVEFPILAKAYYHYKSLHFFGALGPNFSLGILGDTQIKYSDGIDNYYYDGGRIQWGNEFEIDDLRRFNYGVTGGLGLWVNRIKFGLYVDNGLSNFIPENEENTTSYRRSFRFFMSYELFVPDEE